MKYFKQGTIEIPQPENYRDVLKILYADFYRISGKNHFWKMIKYAFTHTGFRFICYFRLCQIKGILFPFAVFLKRLLSNRLGISMSYKTKVGYGLYFYHCRGIFINPSAIIGNNLSISQLVTIGAIEGNAAIIDDNVYIGPNSCIVENVKIGKNSVVGAGAVVTKNVPENCTVGGTPAKIISYNTSEHLIHNPVNLCL